MLSDHLREPQCDITAQIAALCDPKHPKDAVFIGANNAPVYIDVPKVRGVLRDIGQLLTTDKAKAEAFSRRDLSDFDMAKILGYPEAKQTAGENDGCVVVQAMDGKGNVITEAGASIRRLHETVAALAPHVPAGGELKVVTPATALLRRALLTRIEDEPK